jgi:hypothetical protein
MRAWIYNYQYDNGEYVSECAGRYNVDIPARYPTKITKKLKLNRMSVRQALNRHWGRLQV